MPDPSLSRLITQVRAPAIVEMKAAVRAVRAQRSDLIDLGQAIPDFPPPRFALDALADAMAALAPHQYSPDEGLASLRARWAQVLRERFALSADPDGEVLITAGANQAYLLAAMALLNPGDRMGLLSPWYFNHAMAVELVGGTIVELPLRPEDGYQLDADAVLARAKAGKVKALTLVTPSNPTGATYARAEIERLARGLLDAGIDLVVDETYAFYANQAVGHFSAGSLEPRPGRVITLGSFSKTFGATGWRVGYLVASRERVAQMLKAQDAMIICASHPGQLLVEACLEGAWDWVEANRAEAQRRADLLRANAERLLPWKVHSCGPFFAFLTGPADGKKTALSLLREDGVITIPGDSFGSGLQNSLRLALGNAPGPRLLEGLERMARRLGAARH